MAAMDPQVDGSNISKPKKRIRWATQRVPSTKGQGKRNAILNRFHKNSANTEKKRESAGTDSLGGSEVGARQSTDNASDHSNEVDMTRRRIFFNTVLPSDAKDEEGNNLTKFPRNKIRTAKYTPLSFVPKNLWYQFHNIANIYFLFIIILVVSVLMVKLH